VQRPEPPRNRVMRIRRSGSRSAPRGAPSLVSPDRRTAGATAASSPATTRTMRNRAGLLAGAFASLVVVVGIVFGVPWALVRFVGNPLPSGVADLDTVMWSVRNGQIPDRFWIGFLAVVVWVAWAQLSLALVFEAFAVFRRVEAPQLPTFGLAHGLATQLVGAILMVGLVASSLPEDVGALGADSLRLGPAPNPAAETVLIEHAAAESSPPTLRIEVARRQTLRSLAGEHLGDPERWSEIRNHNVGATMPDGIVLEPGFTRISPGWSLEIPGVVAAAADQPVVGEWQVREGDHFWRIASETLGAAYRRPATLDETTSYWRELVALNAPRVESGDPDLIHPGDRYAVTLPPLPIEPVSRDAPIASVPLSLNGLLPENVFEPAAALEPLDPVVDGDGFYPVDRAGQRVTGSEVTGSEALGTGGDLRDGVQGHGTHGGRQGSEHDGPDIASFGDGSQDSGDVLEVDINGIGA